MKSLFETMKLRLGKNVNSVFMKNVVFFGATKEMKR